MVGDIGMHSIDSASPQQSLVEVNSPSNDLMPQEDLYATFNDPLAADKDAYSISNNSSCAELEFVILPHTAHVYFRVLWEQVTRIVSEARLDSKAKDEFANPLTDAFGFKCGGINPEATSVVPNEDPLACERIRRVKASQPVLIQNKLPQTWIDPAYKPPQAQAPPVNPFSFFKRKLLAAPSSEHASNSKAERFTKRKLLKTVEPTKSRQKGSEASKKKAEPAKKSSETSQKELKKSAEKEKKTEPAKKASFSHKVAHILKMEKPEPKPEPEDVVMEVKDAAPDPPARKLERRMLLPIPWTRTRAVILLVRNPVDCYEMTFRELNSEFLKTMDPAKITWQVTFDQYMEDAYLPYLQSGEHTHRRILVRYEDLVDDPGLVMKIVLASTGVGMQLQIPAALIEMRVKKVKYLTEQQGGNHDVGKGFHFVNKLPSKHKQVVVDTLEKYQVQLSNLGYFYYFQNDGKNTSMEKSVTVSHARMAAQRFETMQAALPTNRNLTQGSTAAEALTRLLALDPDLEDNDAPNTLADIFKHHASITTIPLLIPFVILLALALYKMNHGAECFKACCLPCVEKAHLAVQSAALKHGFKHPAWLLQIDFRSFFAVLQHLRPADFVFVPKWHHFSTMVDSYYAMKALIAENKRISVMNFKLALARYQLMRAEGKKEASGVKTPAVEEWRAKQHLRKSNSQTRNAESFLAKFQEGVQEVKVDVKKEIK